MGASEPDDDRSTRARPLGGISATALVVASMIGAGVFTTSGFALADLGSRGAVLAAWVAGGVLAALGALSYGALAVRYPHSGGEYEYLRRSLHPAAGVGAGFVSLFAGFSAPTAYAAAALEAYFWPLVGRDAPSVPWLGSLAILLAAAVHASGVRGGARVQTATVATMLALIVVLVVAGAAYLPSRGSAAAEPLAEFSWLAFGQTSLWVYLAYSGWNAAAYIGGEVEHPERNLPRALLWGTAVVSVLYLALNAVFLWSVPPAELAGRENVASIAAEHLLGDRGRVLVGTVVSLGLLTSILSSLMAGPRVYERMAEDGALPAALRRRRDAPVRSIALQAVLALAMLWAATLQSLMTYIGWTLSVSAALTVVGLMRVRAREGAARVPCFGYPWVPLAFVLGVAWMAAVSVSMSPVESLAGLATVLVGSTVYARWVARPRPA